MIAQMLRQKCLRLVGLLFITSILLPVYPLLIHSGLLEAHAAIVTIALSAVAYVVMLVYLIPFLHGKFGLAHETPIDKDVLEVVGYMPNKHIIDMANTPEHLALIRRVLNLPLHETNIRRLVIVEDHPETEVKEGHLIKRFRARTDLTIASYWVKESALKEIFGYEAIQLTLQTLRQGNRLVLSGNQILCYHSENSTITLIKEKVAQKTAARIRALLNTHQKRGDSQLFHRIP